MTASLPAGRGGQALALGLVLVALGVLWLGIAHPLIGWYEAREATLSVQEDFAARLAARAAQLPALERAEAMLRRAPKSGSPDRLLAGSTDAIAGASLQQIVQGLAHRDGAVISSAETLAPAAAGRYRRIRLRITASGSWPVLVRLLGGITDGRSSATPTMLIDDLRLQAGDLAPKEAAPPLTALFTVIAFRAESAHPSPRSQGNPVVVK